MNDFISLSATTNALIEDVVCEDEYRKLSKSIQSRYRSAATKHNWHCSYWDGKTNKNRLHVKLDEFFDWIKDKHPELIHKLPLEHQKIWKRGITYLNSCYSIGGYNPPKNVTYEMLLMEISRLESLVADQKAISDKLRPDALKYREICAKNKRSAKKKRVQ